MILFNILFASHRHWAQPPPVLFYHIDYCCFMKSLLFSGQFFSSSFLLVWIRSISQKSFYNFWKIFLNCDMEIAYPLHNRLGLDPLHVPEEFLQLLSFRRARRRGEMFLSLYNRLGLDPLHVSEEFLQLLSFRAPRQCGEVCTLHLRHDLRPLHVPEEFLQLLSIPHRGNDERCVPFIFSMI